MCHDSRSDLPVMTCERSVLVTWLKIDGKTGCVDDDDDDGQDDDDNTTTTKALDSLSAPKVPGGSH